MNPMRQAVIWRRFGYLYLAGALLAFSWITLESIFIKGLSIEFLLEFSFPANGVILSVKIAMLLAFTFIRLHPYWRTTMRPEDMRPRLHRFPMEAYAAIVVFGVVVIPLYHVVHYVALGHSLREVAEPFRLNFIRSFLYEMCIVMAVAVFYYAMSRRILRPLLLQLPDQETADLSGKSFIRILTGTFAHLLLTAILMVLWYVLERQENSQPVDYRQLGGLLALAAAFSFGIFMLLVREYQRDLRVMISELGRVEFKPGDSSRLPILSNDEIGMLALSINRHQARLKEEYVRIRKQFELARKVQDKLLPTGLGKSADKFEAMTLPRKEISSGFYDRIEIGDGKTAYSIGDVTGDGLPGALMMSAALVVIRAELRSGESAGGTLRRVNRQLLNPESGMGVSLGIAIVDRRAKQLEYALTGHMRGIVAGSRGNRGMVWQDQLLGICPEPDLQQHGMRVESSDRIVLYSSAFDWSVVLQPMDKLKEWALACNREQGERRTDFTVLSADCHSMLGGEEP